MDWQAEIPSLPQSIAVLPNDKPRLRAELAWSAAATLDSAIHDWEQMFRRPGREDFDFQTAEEIARAGRAAITTLGLLQVRCQSIKVSEDAPDSFYTGCWPVPPSEMVDRTWYTDPVYDEFVNTQLVLMVTVLWEDVRNLLDLLRQSPDVAFVDTVAVVDDTAFIAAKTLREQRGKKKVTINDRLRLTLLSKPESKGWTVTEWQAELKCSRGAIGKSDVWQELESARKLGKSERRKDRRHRRPKNV
jgi:hypothetical protein